ncbi:UDP-glycosyltransferase TURAN-like isoform X2 [Rutidosis leptorrhynchoides]
MGGSDPHSALVDNHSLHIHTMSQWPTNNGALPKLFRSFMLLLKPVIQFITLLWFLCVKIKAPDVFIVQNPPSVPTLVALKWASWMRQSSVIIDWHNFGYTLLALSLGRSSRFVAVYHWIELHFGQFNPNHTNRATVLYDQPPEFFRPAQLYEKRKLFFRIKKDMFRLNSSIDCISYGITANDMQDPNTTIFTNKIGDNYQLRQNRPALTVSSTSWTPDEDFGILLEAVMMYDRRFAALLNENVSNGDEVFWKDVDEGKTFSYPRLLFVITGKGPEKEKYEEKIKKLNLKRVAFRTMWLSPEDYPLLLGSADLGVCLHTSSSGLDLPMKVVDMFGCGLPVCAVSYSCITELVKVDKNGLLFSSSSELADELMMLFKGFPNECDALKTLRNGVLETGLSARWATEWEANAKPLISKVIAGDLD